MSDNSGNYNPQNPYNQQPPPQGQPGQSYGAPYTQQPQGNPQPGYGPPQQLGRQPYQQQPFGNQPYGQQPYGAPVAAGPSSRSKLFGWLTALFGVIAIACCFGPWASLKVSSSTLPISASMSVNAFDHTSCSGPGDVCDDSNSGSGSTSSTSTSSTTSDDDGSIWEGWPIAAIGAAAIVLGVLRGLGKRALSIPAGVVGAAGGLAVVGLTIYRWSWIHDKAGEAEDQLKASGGMAGSIDFHFGSGWGLWLTLVAGILLLLAGVGGLVKRQ